MNGKQAKRLRRKARGRGNCARDYEDRGRREPVRLTAQCDRGIYQALKRFDKRMSKVRNWRVAA